MYVKHQEPEHRQHLQRNMRLVQQALGVAVTSHIVPLVVGDTAATLGAARHLLQVRDVLLRVVLLRATQVLSNVCKCTARCSPVLDTQCGFHVPAIRPPTVPVGTSRLRLSLSAAHSESDIEGLGSAVRTSGVQFRGVPTPSRL